jgi:hypothetical protein
MTQPTFFIDAPFIRGGPCFGRVNPEAIEHVVKTGKTFTEIYPEGVAELRAIAPHLMTRAEINPAAKTFVEVTGLPFAEIYPEHGAIIVIEPAAITIPSPRIGPWPFVALGLVVGALLAGPVGAVCGLAICLSEVRT